MKSFTTIMLCILSISLAASANDNKQKNQSTQVELTKTDDRSLSNGRPRCPARHNEIECFYQDGYLYLTFETPEGYATITISDIMNNKLSTITFSTLSPLTLSIIETAEPLKIEIATENNTYEGWLIL